jgi:hypothetical protein
MEQFGSGLVAGISVPNTPIIADALDYAQRADRHDLRVIVDVLSPRDADREKP